MKTSILKYCLALAGGVLLLAGCASSGPSSGTGAMGNENQTIQSTGPNGSVGPGNPLGIGDGGLTR